MGEPLSWEELSKKRFLSPEFLVDPYIPRQGIVLLWGRTSIGKSPVTWELARSVGEGTSFFGLPTQVGKVLYLEFDTPEVSIARRISFIPPADNVWWMFLTPLSLPLLSPEEKELLVNAGRDIKPDVVFINTLRKVHDLDDKESRTPKIVYTAFKKLFPLASLVFVHHERKQPQDPRFIAREQEGFAGSNHWLADAQVGLHLEPFEGAEGKENLRLYHRKSQVSELLKPLRLYLARDGATLTSPTYSDLLRVYELLNEFPSLPKGELDSLISSRLGCGLSTARARRSVIEQGLFPGSRRFLEDFPSRFEEAIE